MAGIIGNSLRSCGPARPRQTGPQNTRRDAKEERERERSVAGAAIYHPPPPSLHALFTATHLLLPCPSPQHRQRRRCEVAQELVVSFGSPTFWISSFQNCFSCCARCGAIYPP